MTKNIKRKIRYQDFGAPPMYADPEDLKKKIAEYFEKGVPYRKVLVGPPNNRHVEEVPVITITGLALYCGFASRQSFYDYEKKEGKKAEEFAYTIKRARAFIEQEYEMLLQTVGGSAVIFALKNFGWEDKNKVEHTISDLGNSINAARERARAAEKKD